MYLSISSKEVPSGAVAIMLSLLLSSSGANSEGIVVPKPTIAITDTTVMASAIHRLLINAVNDFS